MKKKKKEENKKFALAVNEAAETLVRDFLVPGIKLLLIEELSKIRSFDNRIKEVGLCIDAQGKNIISLKKSILKLEGKTGQEILKRILKEI